LFLLLLAAACLNAQVVLSRRVYAEHGRTFRQLWISAAGSTAFRQLTRSARDHGEPVCSRDGRLIYFVSDRDASRSLNSYLGANDRELWAFDRQTGQERRLGQSSADDGLDIYGATADGAVLIRIGTELRCLFRHPWRTPNVDAAVLSPDGRTLAAVIGARLFLLDAATGRSRLELGEYQEPAWSPDGARISAVANGSLVILDAATRQEFHRIPWIKRDDPADDLLWSPDGNSLLVGLHGENAGSGDPQQDYFLVNLAAATWTPALTARKLLWLPGGTTLLYLRPVATAPLAPGSPHQVWTTQLAAFDLATRKDTELTTGLVLNDDLSSCR
jgi:Tol biopolymer transport system component